MIKPYDSKVSATDLRIRKMKVLETFRSVAVGLERDLMLVGAREEAQILGAARQAAEHTLAAECQEGDLEPR